MENEKIVAFVCGLAAWMIGAQSTKCASYDWDCPGTAAAGTVYMAFTAIECNGSRLAPGSTPASFRRGI